MPRRDLTFRVFVSSTFSDLVAERSALQEQVYPKLREYCRSKGASFQAIDLRWGVAQEAALDQQTMNICLSELQRCQDLSPRPNFIVLLGERYGWRPLPVRIEAREFEALSAVISERGRKLLGGWYLREDNAVPAEYVLQPRTIVTGADAAEEERRWSRQIEPVLRHLLAAAARRVFPDKQHERRQKYEDSATHQEIRVGALRTDRPHEHIFAYLRSIDDLPADCRDYRDLLPDGGRDIEAIDRLSQLTAELIRLLPAKHVYPYRAQWRNGRAESDLAALCARVETDLQGVIDQELAAFGHADELKREIEAHEEFGRERARNFIGRADLLASIDGYVRAPGTRQPLLVYGKSGSGKTAVMAKATIDCAKAHPGRVTITRIIGATPSSSQITSLLQGIAWQIGAAYGATAEVPADYRQLASRLPEWLKLATAECPLTIFLDALDQLTNTEDVQRLGWMPRELPEHVTLVISAVEEQGPAGDCLRVAQEVIERQNHLPLRPLDLADGAAMLDLWLRDAGRTLQPTQRANLLGKFSVERLPLYLKLAFEEARRWKSFTPIEQTVLPPGVDELILRRIEHLSQQQHHSALLVNRVLGYLAAARHGLSEDELVELLALDEEYWNEFTRSARHKLPRRHLPPVVWSRLHHDLGTYLRQQNWRQTTLLGFYHRQLRDVVVKHLVSGDDRTARHRQLASYFAAQPLRFEDAADPGRRLPNARKLSELPFHQIYGGLREDLARDDIGTLTSFDFIDAKCRAGMVAELQEDYRLAIGATPARHASTKRPIPSSGRVLEALRADTAARRAVPLQEPCFAEGKPAPLDWFAADTSLAAAIAAAVSAERRGGAPRAGRHLGNDADVLSAYGQFVSLNFWTLSRPDWDILSLARNYAQDGPVVAKAEAKLKQRGRPWLARQFRPPLPSKRSALIATLEGHEAMIGKIAVSKDSEIFIAAARGDIRAWDASWTQCTFIEAAHERAVNDLALSADGKTAVSCGMDGLIKVWEIPSGRCLRTIKASSDSVTHVGISHDARFAISCGHWDDAAVSFWDLSSGERVLGPIKTVTPKGVAISADGRIAVSVHGDQLLRVWDTSSGVCLHAIEIADMPKLTGMAAALNQSGQLGSIQSVVLSEDGSIAVTTDGRRESCISVWHLETGRCIRRFHLREGSDHLRTAISANGRVIAALCSAHLMLFDNASGASFW